MKGYRDTYWKVPGSHLERELEPGVDVFFPAGDQVCWNPSLKQEAALTATPFRRERFQLVERPDAAPAPVVVPDEAVEIESPASVDPEAESASALPDESPRKRKRKREAEEGPGWDEA